MPSHSVPSCTANTATVQTSKPAACYWSLMVPGKCLINQRKDLHCSLLGDNSFSCSHWSISVMISLLIATFCRNYQALVSASLRCREKGSRFKKKKPTKHLFKALAPWGGQTFHCVLVAVRCELFQEFIKAIGFFFFFALAKFGTF